MIQRRLKAIPTWLGLLLASLIPGLFWVGEAGAQGEVLHRGESPRLVSTLPVQSKHRILDQRLDFNLHDVPLPVALEMLARTGIALVYPTELVGNRGPVSCDCEGLTGTQALHQILSNTGLEYDLLATGEVILRERPGGTQQRTGIIRGRVIDHQSGEGISGVNIWLVGTELRAVTTREGNYILRNVPAGPQRIRAERLGYIRTEQVVTLNEADTMTVNLAMSIDPVTLSPLEVRVSTGSMIATERRAIGTSMAVIDAAELEASGVRDLKELLQGRIAGATSFGSTAIAGEAQHILIRGASSFMMDQTPLIYIDGVPVDVGNSAMNQKGMPNAYEDAESGAHLRLDDLVLDEVERIEIIKGPAATTLFGAEGINGVIQIFTKRGSPGSSRISVNIDQGFKTLNKRKTFVKGSPYVKELDKLFRSPRNHTFTGTMSGGFGDVSYNLSGTHYRDDGIVPGNDEDKTTLRVSLRALPRENLSVQLSGTFVHRSFNSRSYTQLFRYADLGYDEEEEFVHETIMDALENGRKRNLKLNRFYGSLSLNYTPFSFWRNNVTVGLDESLEVNETVGYSGQENGVTRERRERDFTRSSVKFHTTLAYPNTGSLTSTFTAGVEAYQERTSRFRMRGNNLPNNRVTNFDQAEQLLGGDSSYPTDIYTALGSVGIFVQEQLGFFDRFFLTGGFRMDGNTAFGRNLGFQAFPKVNAAYVHDITPWWTTKLRAAWGESGKAPEPFLRDMTLNLSRSAMTGLPQYTLDYPGNADLKPEKGSEVEIGAEMYFFRNRAIFEVNYFRQETKGALLHMPISWVSGFRRGPLGNIGALRSSGLEVTTRLTPYRRGARSLTMGFNLTHMIEDGVITKIGDYDKLYFTNQTTNWRNFDGMGLGMSVRELLFRSIFNDPVSNYSVMEPAGSKVPTTYGGFNLTYNHRAGTQIYIDLAYRLGGRAFDHVLARRDVAKGLYGSTSSHVPEVALNRYIIRTDQLKLTTIRANYRLPSKIARLIAKQVDLSFQASDIFSMDVFKRGEPGMVPIDGFSLTGTGSVGYALPNPQSYKLGLRMNF